jgi:hypothetical protein
MGERSETHRMRGDGSRYAHPSYAIDHFHQLGSANGTVRKFFRKKQKLLHIGAAPVRPARLQTNKSFLLLFFKKEVLTPSEDSIWS